MARRHHLSRVTSSTDRLADLQARLRQFTGERDWDQFHNPKNLAMAIASEAGELLAELRWVNGLDSDKHVRSDEHRSAIEHEVADVAIALLLFCDRAGINLLDAIGAKIEVNRTRYPVDTSKGK